MKTSGRSNTIRIQEAKHSFDIEFPDINQIITLMRSKIDDAFAIILPLTKEIIVNTFPIRTGHLIMTLVSTLQYNNNKLFVLYPANRPQIIRKVNWLTHLFDMILNAYNLLIEKYINTTPACQIIPVLKNVLVEFNSQKATTIKTGLDVFFGMWKDQGKLNYSLAANPSPFPVSRDIIIAEIVTIMGQDKRFAREYVITQTRNAKNTTYSQVKNKKSGGVKIIDDSGTALNTNPILNFFLEHNAVVTYSGGW